VTRRLAAIGVAAAVSAAQVAWAQAPTAPRAFVAVNSDYQLAANDFADGAVKRANAEDGRFDTTYTVAAGRSFSISGGARLWRQLAVGVGLSRFAVSTPVSLNGTVPHPFFFSRPRPVSGTAPGLTREERTLHLQVGGVFALGPRIQLMAFAGPSFFHITQGVVTDFTYTESYPYDDARFAAATTTTASASTTGFNAGGDVAFFFTRQLGVGAMVQLSGTTIDLPAAGGGSRRVKVGGGHAGGGLRLRF